MSGRCTRVGWDALKVGVIMRCKGIEVGGGWVGSVGAVIEKLGIFKGGRVCFRNGQGHFRR